MEGKTFFRPLHYLHYLLPGLLALAACTADPVTTVNQNNLDNLALPGQTSASASPTTPIVLAPSASPATSTHRVSNLLAWEVKPSGQTAPVSYLIGTVHAPFASGYTLPAAFSAKLAASQDFYLEADVDQLTQAMSDVVQQAIDAKQNLQAALGSDYWTKLKARLSEIGLSVPEQALNLFKPWYVNVMISGAPDNSDPTTIMDLVLRSQASKAGLSLKYLEAATEQLQDLQAISDAEHLRLIKLNLDQGLARQVSDEQKVFAIYNSGDLPALTSAAEEARTESAEYYQHMVLARNQKWVSQLKTALNSRSSVVAVGSLHMVGQDGLVSQLQAQGFSVTQVKF